MKKRKKRILAMLLCFCMLFTLVPALGLSGFAEDEIPLEQSGDTEAENEVVILDSSTTLTDGKDECDVEDVFTVDIYVKALSEAGLDSDVKVDFSLVTGLGTLYLPGGVDESQLFFFWDDPEIVLCDGDTSYESGTAPVAASGESVSYTVKKGLAFALCSIETMKGSVDVAPMFLMLDETIAATIEEMNSDETHETTCYGGLYFDGEEYPYIGIKGRGNSTWGLDKKPYNVTFYKADDYDKKANAKLIAGVKAKKWSLLANFLDTSLLRNKTALDLANDLGIGLDSRFVDLYMNGEYLGLYLLTPKNDYQAPDGGYVLENDNYLSSDDPQFQLADMQEPAITDGFYNRITVKDIGDDALDAGETAETIEAWFAEAWAALRDYDSEDYQKYFDSDSWAKMYLMYEVTKTYDAFSGSLLMHRDGLSEDDLMIAGPAWDFDASQGRIMFKIMSGISLTTQITAEGWYVDCIGYTVDDAPVSLLQEFGKHPSFLRHVAQIYNEYKWAFDGMASNVDVQSAIVESSALMDKNLWAPIIPDIYAVPVNEVIGVGKYQLNYQTTYGWCNYANNLKEYLTKRNMWLSDQLYVEAPAGQITGETTVMAYDTLELTAQLDSGADENTFRWQSSKKGKNWDDIEGATEQTLKLQVTKADDGMQYRCVVNNLGNTIITTRTDPVKAAAQTILGSVKISVSAHKHSYSEEVVKPTCGVAGYTLYTCSCGDSYTDKPTDALSHSYEKGVCIHCGQKAPEAIVEKRIEKTGLENGKLRMYIGSTYLGEFDFRKVGGGWSIRTDSGKYIAVSDGKLVESDSEFVWTYNNGMFTYTEKVYLTSLSKKLGISHDVTYYLTSVFGSSKLSRVPYKRASFEKEVEYVVG